MKISTDCNLIKAMETNPWLFSFEIDDRFNIILNEYECKPKIINKVPDKYYKILNNFKYKSINWNIVNNELFINIKI